jgi:hypothetical protein
MQASRVQSYEMGMSLKGEVKNGVVVVPPEANLPDGTVVEVAPVAPELAEPSFLRELLKLAKDRDWPADFALNHAHYAKGHPKQSIRSGPTKSGPLLTCPSGTGPAATDRGWEPSVSM